MALKQHAAIIQSNIKKHVIIWQAQEETGKPTKFQCMTTGTY